MGPALARKYAVIPGHFQNPERVARHHRVFARGTPSKSFVIIERIEIDMTQRSAFWTGETKSGQGRKAVMPPDVFDLVNSLVKGKQSQDFLFTWPNGDRVLDFRVSWRKMCIVAKVSVLLYDFWWSAVRNMTRAGVSRNVAKNISGHQTDSGFSCYNITDENDLADAGAMIQARREISRKTVADAGAADKESVSSWQHGAVVAELADALA